MISLDTVLRSSRVSLGPIFGLGITDGANSEGADLLSSQGARVYMPDFLKGDYATADMFSGTDE